MVIKLSGSVFEPPVDANLISSFCKTFKSITKDKVQPIIVAGGGSVARNYIKILRDLGSDETTQDEIGIAVSRLNAKIMIQGLKDKAFPTVPASMDELSMALCSKPIIVLGGLYPGHSTNATAALVAEKSNACLFINATDVDGVYSDDPRINKKAKKFDQIDTKSLFDLISKSPMSAGAYDLMDPLSVKIIERSRIKTRVILCTPENILAATKGHHIGTEIIVRE